MAQTSKIGVIGASGIGKHHAKWWDMEGGKVCGFVGTTPDSVARTRDLLTDMFGFTGGAYTSLETLLDREEPDIIDVCSPPRFHYDHVMEALDAGCDCLCEKPLLFHPEIPGDELIDEARVLVNKARAAGLRLGMCSQYYTSADTCARILRDNADEDAIKAYRGHIATPADGENGDPYATWIDLAPHMLAGVEALVPTGRIDFGTVVYAQSGRGARASFVMTRTDAPDVECEIITERTTGESDPTHIRRFDINGKRFDIRGENDDSGVYHAVYETPWGPAERPDPMRLLIGGFLSGSTPIDAAAALRNLTGLLRIPSLPGS